MINIYIKNTKGYMSDEPVEYIYKVEEAPLSMPLPGISSQIGVLGNYIQAPVLLFGTKYLAINPMVNMKDPDWKDVMFQFIYTFNKFIQDSSQFTFEYTFNPKKDFKQDIYVHKIAKMEID